jgi:hypothetical protein
MASTQNNERILSELIIFKKNQRETTDMIELEAANEIAKISLGFGFCCRSDDAVIPPAQFYPTTSINLPKIKEST